MPKPSRPLLHEWMHRFVGQDWCVIRVWTQADPDGPLAGEVEFKAQHSELERIVADDKGKKTFRIAELPYVNAVEKIDPQGNGRLVYVDWP